jgi:hypothetical protein
MPDLPVTLSFVREKETKNTIHFQEVAEAKARPVIGSIYLLKSYAKGYKTLEVTIKPEVL